MYQRTRPQYQAIVLGEAKYIAQNCQEQGLVMEVSNIFQEGIMFQRKQNRFRSRFGFPFLDLKHF